MSRAYVTWAKDVRGLKHADRALLLTIAHRVGEDGTWQFRQKDLAEAVEVSKSSLRRIVDRLAERGLLAFKAERYQGGEAQAGHRYMLIRDEEALRLAETLGFAKKRQELGRDQAERTEGGSKMDPGVGSDWTRGGSNTGPRVGSLLDPRIQKQNTLSKHTIRPKPDKPVRTRRVYPADFEAFWAAYPTDKLMSKAEAWKVWAKLNADDRKAAIAAVPEFIRTWKKNQPNTRYLHALRFLSQRRFDSFAASPGAEGAEAVDDPMYDFPGGYKRRESFLREAVVKFRAKPTDWPPFIGPPPGSPGCRVPEWLLEEAVV